MFEMNPVVWPTQNIFNQIISSQIAMFGIGFVIWFVASWIWVRVPRLAAMTAVATTITGIVVSYLLVNSFTWGNFVGLFVATVVATFAILWLIHKDIKKCFAIVITAVFLSSIVMVVLGLGATLGVI